MMLKRRVDVELEDEMSGESAATMARASLGTGCDIAAKRHLLCTSWVPENRDEDESVDQMTLPNMSPTNKSQCNIPP
ncbi:uncharacterized protein PFLUO_LOCUS6649 [Penicillium psychrofluorescens]|uniref:uncharacterized protein n=1 Tax=Penicillium psychrofluorescens TaxID=3158075 RepID=UPI003CCD9783